MKRILTALCALALFAATATPALAAESSLPGHYYPISVEEYTYGPFDELRVNKVYQLSLSDDPSLIPTDDFERSGRRYSLLDMVRENTVGVDTREYTETVTMDSDTGDMAAMLNDLDGQMELTTEDGYTGTLVLDHTSVKVEVKGYQTSTRNLSATRTYPGLSDADVSLIPKTVTDNGSTLTLADVQWACDGITPPPPPIPAASPAATPPAIRSPPTTPARCPKRIARSSSTPPYSAARRRRRSRRRLTRLIRLWKAPALTALPFHPSTGPS